MANENTTDLIRRATGPGSPERRSEALERLGELGSQEGLQLALRLIDDPEVPVRASAARTLGCFSDARAVECLQGAAEDRLIGRVAKQALQAIAERRRRESGQWPGGPATPKVPGALSSNPVTRRFQVAAIAMLLGVLWQLVVSAVLMQNPGIMLAAAPLLLVAALYASVMWRAADPTSTWFWGTLAPSLLVGWLSLSWVREILDALRRGDSGGVLALAPVALVPALGIHALVGKWFPEEGKVVATPRPTGPLVPLSANAAAALRDRYAQLPTEELEGLLAQPGDLVPGAEPLLREELGRRPRP
jgi:hypothetical protein